MHKRFTKIMNMDGSVPTINPREYNWMEPIRNLIRRNAPKFAEKLIKKVIKTGNRTVTKSYLKR